MNYSSGITSDDEDMENQMVGNGASEARTNESELSETLLDVANRMALAGEDTPMQEEATHEHKKQKHDHTESRKAFLGRQKTGGASTTGKTGRCGRLTGLMPLAIISS